MSKILFLFLALISLFAFQAASAATPQEIKALQLIDIEGNRHELFSDESTKAVALIFVSPDCPIANSFQPWIQKLHQAYADKPVQCFMVHCTTMSDQDEIADHVKEHAIKMPVVLDAKQDIGSLVQATSTPEAIVIDQQGVIRYRGLINDLYSPEGLPRPEPTEHYLTAAFDALIEGQPIATESTRPFGCKIYYPRSRRK